VHVVLNVVANAAELARDVLVLLQIAEEGSTCVSDLLASLFFFLLLEFKFLAVVVVFFDFEFKLLVLLVKFVLGLEGFLVVEEVVGDLVDRVGGFGFV